MHTPLTVLLLCYIFIPEMNNAYVETRSLARNGTKGNIQIPPCAAIHNERYTVPL